MKTCSAPCADAVDLGRIKWIMRCGVTKHRFGGNWTEQKLESLKAYLDAYMNVMQRQPFRLLYIDAFAGTGYCDTEKTGSAEMHDFAALFDESEAKSFLKGSAVRALEVQPPFHGYVFVEQKPSHASELEALKLRYEHLASRIQIQRGDGNAAVQSLCDRENWNGTRAVLFLDPYGMQVTWDTIVAVAKTRAIDMFVLFPAAIAVNRTLTKNAKPPESWRKRLDLVFGTDEWERRFYSVDTEDTLFGPQETTRKCPMDAIGEFYIERLQSVFPAVAPKPQRLPKKGRMLYLLCFAAGNPKGGKIAVKIANHLFRN
jgi:three-Cys-motif partner protein